MLTSIANSLGFGSGIDTAALVSDLAAASRTPKVQRFDTLARANQAKISALAQARSDLDSFANSLTDLVAGGSLRSQSTVSDSNALAITIEAGATLSSYSGEITVSQLAKSQTIYSGFIPDPSTAVGHGGMTLTVNGIAHEITVNATNDNLSGLADAVNAAGAGVRATVVTDTAGSRLVLKGASGAANAFTLTADSGADPLLDRFTYSGTGTNMTLGQAASDATFLLDGVAYSRATNSISDVVLGMTITLKKADPLAPIAIGTTRPTDAVKQTINDFISVFNTLKKDMTTARQANNGSQSLRAFEKQITALVSQPLTGNPDIRSLSDIGISTNRDGSISLNTARLDAALATNPDAVEALFNPPRDATHDAVTDPGIAVALDNLRDAATAANGALDQINASLQKQTEILGQNRAKMEVREDAYRARLEKQFSGMDARIGALKATQSYLEQQIKLWNQSDG
jgi:flagellar hook-associated protein 2